MDKQQLEELADRIESIMQFYHQPVTVTGGAVYPQYIKFTINPQAALLSDLEPLADQLAAQLGVASVHITHAGEKVQLEIPHPNPPPLDLLKFMARIPPDRIPAFTATLGLADDGVPLLLRLPAADVGHLLISGERGAGKTTLLQTIMLSLALAHPFRAVQFVAISASDRRAFADLSGLPNLMQQPITAYDDITAVLINLRTLAYKRRAEQVADPRIVVVIDELADLNQHHQSDNQAALLDLIERGREAGIHVVASTDRPASALLEPIIGAPFNVRIVGHLTDRQARAAAGVANLPVDQLLGNGDFMAVYGSQVYRFQAAQISDADLASLPARLGAGERRSTIIPDPRGEQQPVPRTARPAREGRHANLHVDWDTALGSIPGL